MKIFFAVIVASMLAACSSSKPLTEKNQAVQPQVTTPAPEVHDNAKIDSKMESGVIKKEVCDSGKDERVLEVHNKKPGCELSYTKFGKLSVVSSGKHGTKHCEDSFEKITKKLEAQKFQCHST